jgi:hypothetical protein
LSDLAFLLLLKAFGFLDAPEVWQEHWSADKHVEDKFILVGMLQV